MRNEMYQRLAFIGLVSLFCSCEKSLTDDDLINTCNSTIADNTGKLPKAIKYRKLSKGHEYIISGIYADDDINLKN